RKVTLFMGVPTMYFKLLEVEALEKYDTSSMRLFVSGSAPLSRDLFNKFKKTFGHEILERAGMSESMMNFSNPYDGERVPGSVGPCLPGVKVRITDKHFNDVPVSTEGEILIKGPNVFSGYWNKPHYNREVFKDGWFVTGDVGKIDEKGYVYIIGRSKDVIISGGINIYPREIEDVIESMPQVKECAVVGVPDKEFGESVKAYVVLNQNAKSTEDEVIAYCREKLASFKKPKFVEFLEALPKNSMGKILKEELRKMHKGK
ncbi:AMP-binding protein, partial [Candidatus Woesearchaeota archaeon]|nr:AMP-binding protein [Candidatus Woesearchaeota archaeon]